MVHQVEAVFLTTVSICCTISLEAHRVYARHSARREGSSMVSTAILFYEQHGPLSKTGLSRELKLREQRIRFFQKEIRSLNNELRAAGDDSLAIWFDEETGLFVFKD